MPRRDAAGELYSLSCLTYDGEGLCWQSQASIIRIDLINDALFAYLSPLELARMAKVSRIFHAAIAAYIAHAYHPCRLLSGFFQDIPSFRALQARTGSLISGRSALHFLDRSLYPSDPLDLFIYFHHRREVVSWILHAGYVFLPAPDQSSDVDFAVTAGILQETASTTAGVCGVLSFGLGGPKSSKLVRVVVAMRTPIEVILLSQTSEFTCHIANGSSRSISGLACLINAISYEKAYCLFPCATLHQRRSLLTNSTEAPYMGTSQDVIELEERGFEMMEYLDCQDLVLSRTSSPILFGWRWIDDSASWVISFSTEGIRPPASWSASPSAQPYDPVSICGFSLRYTEECRVHLAFTVLDGPVIQYSYAIGDRDLLERLVISLYHCSPTWDGKLCVSSNNPSTQCSNTFCSWDHEVRDICRESLADLVAAQEDVIGILTQGAGITQI